MAGKVEISLDNFKELTSCGVCLSQLRDPWQLPCGHNFCHEPCLASLFLADMRTCPTCRAEYKDKDVKPFHFYRRLVEAARFGGNDPEVTLGQAWTSTKLPPRPAAAYEVPMYICERCDTTEDMLAAVMQENPHFIPVSQRPINERRCPNWRTCPRGPSCPYRHAGIPLCIELFCPGGEICDLLHCDDILDPMD